VTSDFDPEFKKKMRRLITERLAQEAASGRSWKVALEGLKDLFDIDEAELERDIASLKEIRSWEAGHKVGSENPPIDLNAERLQREIAKSGHSSASSPEGGSYGSGVRKQVFEVIVRQGVVGAPWREICAGPLRVNNIDPEEIQAEIDRRKKMTDDGGGMAKSSVPKKPYPTMGGALKALLLPDKDTADPKSLSGQDSKSQDSKSHDSKSHDSKSHDNKSDDHTDRKTGNKGDNKNVPKRDKKTREDKSED